MIFNRCFCCSGCDDKKKLCFFYLRVHLIAHRVNALYTRADAMCVQITLWKKSEKENLQLRVLSNEILDMKVEERGKWSAGALGTTFNPNE